MWPERAMGLGVFIAVTAVALVLVLPSLSPPDSLVPLAGPIHMSAEDDDRKATDEPLTLAAFEGRNAPVDIHGIWFDERVVVLKLQTALVSASTPSLPLPGDPTHSLVGYSARSTHLGCTVSLWVSQEEGDWADQDGDHRSDGYLLDLCHQGQWDPYNEGMHVAGFGDGPLWTLDLSIAPDGIIIGSASI